MEQDAIRVVEVNKQLGALTLNTTALEQLLNKPEIRDRSIAVISIAGAIRKGKSFMLNFFIRYLQSKYNSNAVSNYDWLGDRETPLTGFSWRGGSERNTTGVLVWPELFLHDYPNGKKIAIMIIDTQGTFDSKTTFDGNVTIFSLSTMISSLQIYNISNNIQEDQLQYLSLFAEYGKLALQNPLNKPFQKLLFLIRDWFYPYEAPYGYTGGQTVLERALHASAQDDVEKQEMRRNIIACFDKIECYLMPYPGAIVATNPNFQGKLKDIEAEFITALQEFVPSILSPEKLIAKQVNGVDIRAQDFVYYLKSYMKILTDHSLPSPKTILSATAEAQNLSAVAEAKDIYQGSMDVATRNTNRYLSYGEIAELHRQNNERAIQTFERIPKLQSEKSSDEYEHELEADLKKDLHYYLIRNEKNRPNLDPKVEELINAITKERDISNDLNATNTKLILDMINTLNASTEEYRNEVNQMIAAFKENKNKGMETIDIIKEIVNIIPHIIGIFALF